ncbi:IS3 family transposase [Mycoplasma mycoides subsp. capri]|uniref:IS3 family transposase n=1 Tax=Mycoplasma mycoides TaxID=2102 RepID=UPI00223F705D|nr:IS3 family transposase [Mycoplasma mycoides]QVJ95974.1 IS3 family transposase [Mycoplasma mycoides subsp. capri]QVJ96462.1 IS3 family transposase [Mycoplasma mycoides subsp. capri]QVJ96475.1 IS3 family transposase [Mycoplasma mycoides subsp. capri]QVJ96616.1 IS3 family transposase [Mycoplasma mycoides subsp. capri]QVJ96737.1 IS3 family transposase [Mycoplasma mycoides subsp. capri]
MSKLNLEKKLKIVKEAKKLNIKKSTYIANKYDISVKTVESLVNRFEAFGIEGLINKEKKPYYSAKLKLKVVLYKLETNHSYDEVAKKFNIIYSSTIAGWVKKYREYGFLGLNNNIGRPKKIMKNPNKKPAKIKKSQVKIDNEQQIKELKEQVEYYKLEAEFWKKFPRLVDKRKINKEKTKVVLELLKTHKKVKISILLKIAKLPKSSFYEWKYKLENTIDKNKELKEMIVDIFNKSFETYGYRRLKIALESKGYIVNHKKILRLTKELGVQCIKFRTKNGRYSSYKGTVGKIANNILKRNFHSLQANKLWCTDITEFKVNGQKLYLSPIIDLYNNEIISYSIQTNPNLNLTNSMLDKALKKVKNTNGLLIHSDQGFHYQHISWVKKLEENNITQSMSRKGNCLDNAIIENFFGLLKQEIYYGEKYNSVEELTKRIHKYIYWYNNIRIKEKLKGLSPVQFRKQSCYNIEKF